MSDIVPAPSQARTTPAPASLLVGRVGQRLCGLALEGVVETMRPPARLVPLDGAPPAVCGLALIRGGPTPVVDLAVLFGDAPLARPTRLVTVQVGQRQVGLLFDEILGLRTLDAASLDGAPDLSPPGAGHAAGWAVFEDSLLVLLRTVRLVPEVVWEEAERVAQEAG